MHESHYFIGPHDVAFTENPSSVIFWRAFHLIWCKKRAKCRLCLIWGIIYLLTTCCAIHTKQGLVWVQWPVTPVTYFFRRDARERKRIHFSFTSFLYPLLICIWGGGGLIYFGEILDVSCFILYFCTYNSPISIDTYFFILLLNQKKKERRDQNK